MISRTRSSPRLQLALAALLFSTGGAAIKAVTLNGWQVAGLRSGIAALVIFLLVPAARRGWSWRTLLVGVGYAATLILFVVANKLTTSANTIFLQSTAPLYMVFLSPLLLHEKVRRSDIITVGVVAIGLALFFVGSERPYATAPNPFLGNVLAAFSGLGWAFTVSGLRWLSRDGTGERGTACVVAGNFLALLICLPMMFPLTGATMTDWVTISYLGVFQIGAAYLLVTSALRHLTALEASVILLIEPALNPLFAWLAHGERPSLWAIAGGVLIIGATTVKALMTEKSERSEKAEKLETNGGPAPSPVDGSDTPVAIHGS